ncbi:hypothetical protein O6H91_15G029800 [Diphasiastrum complanatum]|uniref:Uncharacterized protein n=1 Tax=Diphasiastrum complanatum TaxID=34168 RepID=A0ACC2BGX7_DIPCM|nr:hypothetical protein O6H91_15G029800 [Diphasiastrum complanatum]
MAFSYCMLTTATTSSHPFAPLPSLETTSLPFSSSSICLRSNFCFPSAAWTSMKLSQIATAFPAASSCGSSRATAIAAAYSSTSSSSSSDRAADKEEIFFDGGPHYGDLVLNLVFGFSIIWLPLTLAAVLRALFLRYRFSTARVTILSGLAGEDRKDFTYDVIKDVALVPRLFGEWGDVVITLTDGTKVDLRSVPKFRQIAEYCRKKSGQQEGAEELSPSVVGPKGFS